MSAEQGTNQPRDVTPIQEAEARAAAVARGHKDTNHMVRTTEGLVPVWRFYVGFQHPRNGS